MEKHVWILSSKDKHPELKAPMVHAYRCKKCKAGPLWVHFGEKVEDVAKMSHDNYRRIAAKKAAAKKSAKKGAGGAPTLTRAMGERPLPEECPGSTGRN